MNLQRLQHYIEQYKRSLRRHGMTEDRLFPLETQLIWQQNWDWEASDFAAIYDKCLQNSYSKRIWKGNNFDPKAMMLKFIDQQPDFTRYLFKDLFDETKDITGRTGRFVFHCDELLQAYKEAHPRSIENNHFHDDYWMVSVYLSCRFPAEYALYDYPAFQKMMEKVGGKPVEGAHDVTRFFKVARTFSKFLYKDEKILEFHNSNRIKNKHYMEETMLLVNDFMKVCTTEGMVRDF